MKNLGASNWREFNEENHVNSSASADILGGPLSVVVALVMTLVLFLLTAGCGSANGIIKKTGGSDMVEECQEEGLIGCVEEFGQKSEYAIDQIGEFNEEIGRTSVKTNESIEKVKSSTRKRVVKVAIVNGSDRTIRSGELDLTGLRKISPNKVLSFNVPVKFPARVVEFTLLAEVNGEWLKHNFRREYEPDELRDLRRIPVIVQRGDIREVHEFK